ncbi:hypothetical protein [Streptomyces sp. NPDC051776]|uniref:hypothetical protein n=1 Tax=Streptomyces sp. NPDC051776 TaxID=3155414 RepID=UPI003429688A
MFLVGTVRSRAPLSDAVAGLDRGDRSTRIDLQEWSLQQIEAVLSTVLDGPVERSTAHRLHHISGGNALFLKELVHGALHQGVLIGNGGVWRLAGPVISTQRVDEIIKLRIRSVSAWRRRASNAPNLLRFPPGAWTRRETSAPLAMR